MSINISTASAAISAAGAVAAAWFAWVSARAERRANELIEREHSLRLPNIDLYLIAGSIHRFKAFALRVYDFRVRITNCADSAASIVELILEIEYTRGNQWMARLQVPLDPQASALLPSVQAAPLQTPSSLGPRSSVEGSAIFRLPMEMIRGARIARYYVVAVDTGGSRWEVVSVGLHEQEYE